MPTPGAQNQTYAIHETDTMADEMERSHVWQCKADRDVLEAVEPRVGYVFVDALQGDTLVFGLVLGVEATA